MSSPDPHETPARDVRAGEAFGPYGPLFLVVPLLTLVLGVLWSRGGSGEPAGQRPAPPPLEDGGPVAGWSGSLELAGGTRLDVRLTPLHAGPRQQEFDRDTLRRLLELDSGEPWRLTLERGAGPGADLSLDALRVGSDGGVLAPPAAPQVPAGQPADPVRVLLGPPREPLAPGQEVSLVLWGKRPAGAVHLDLGDLRFELLPEEVPHEAVVRSLARLEVGSAQEEERR